MFSTVQIRGQKKYGSVTQTAGTIINRMIEPMRNAIAVIEKIIYINQADAHTITILRALGVTTFAADAAASQAAFTLTADPGVYLPASSWSTANNTIAAGDYVVYRCADGTYRMDTIASGTQGGGNLTMTNNFPTLGVTAGDPLWFFGIKTDTNPKDAQAHPKLTVIPSGSGYGVKEFNDAISAFDFYEPMIVQSDNLTSAGTLNQVSVVYVDRPGPNQSTPDTLSI